MGKKKRRKKKNQPFSAPQPSSSEDKSLSAHKPVPVRFRLLALISIFLIGMLVYANSFQNEFIWDDLVIIEPSEYIREFNIAKIFTTDVHHFSYQPSNFYRPLQMLSFALNYRIGGLNPFGYHVFNALVHTLNACLLFLVFCQLNVALKLADHDHWRWLALFSCLIWLVHPIHTQNTTYVSGRADLLVTFFVLLSFFSYIRGKRALTSVFFIGALLSKELAIITPLFLLLYDIVIDQKFAKAENRGKEVLVSYGPLFLIALIYAALRLSVFNFPTAFTTEEIPGLGPRLLTSALSIIKLLGLLAVPVNLSMLRNIPWAYSLLSMKIILSILSICVLLGSALWFRKKNPFVSFCIFWFFIAYLPVLNLIPMNANMSEHWMYLPSTFIILLIVYLIWRYVLIRKVAVLSMVMIPVIAGYGYLLFERNKDFKNQIVFFENLLKQHPFNARAHYNLGTSYGTMKEYEKAKTHFEKAIKSDPQHAPAYANLGLIYSRQGNLDKAIALYEKANSLQTNLLENHANLGIAYAQKGRSPEAIRSFQRALKINPKHAASLNGIGIEHAKAGQYDEAENYFKRVLSLYPNHPDAQSNLKRLYAIKRGQQLKER